MARHLDRRLFRESKKASAAIDTIRNLIDQGANVNRKHEFGQTSLHQAAYCGHTGIVQLLLNSGADPTIVADEGDGPLYWAAAGAHLEIASALIEHGANPNEKRGSASNRNTPIWRALSVGCLLTVELLVDSGAEIEQSWMIEEAEDAGFPEIVSYLRSKY